MVVVVIVVVGDGNGVLSEMGSETGSLAGQEFHFYNYIDND